MLKAHTVAQIRAAEDALMGRLPAGELMQRAARGLAEAVRTHVGADDRVIALIGTGNNGGDALFAVGLLRREGIAADVCFADPDRVHKPGLAAALAAGAAVVESPQNHQVVIDALVGIGGRPGLQGRGLEWAQWADDARPYVIAVDIPSGFSADTAVMPESYLRADSVVTLGTYKISSLADPAAAMTPGLPVCVDIGLGDDLGTPALVAYERTDCAAALADFTPLADGHKYSRGVVGIAAGSAEYAGAAHLCVAGAQAGLSGMVRFSGTDGLSRRVVDRAPEVVAGKGRVQAWAVGSGGGPSSETHLRMALENNVPVVVDADALAFLPGELGVPALLTPHAGELASMLSLTRADIESDPLTHAESAARRWGVTVLLKGRRTLIVTPGRPASVNVSGTPWLATAGAGDVLAGLAASILAAGAEPHTAGVLAAYLHGLAAERVNPGGPITAGQVASALPAAIAEVLKP